MKGWMGVTGRHPIRTQVQKEIDLIDGTFHLIRLEKGPDFFLPLDIGQTFLVCN